MKVGQPNQSPTPDYPTRREIIRQAGALGLAAIGLGAAGSACAAEKPVPPPALGGVPPPPAKLAGEPVAVSDTPPGTKPYIVRKGDTVASVAKKQLGDEKRTADIVKANPGLDAKKPLTAGQKIYLPVDEKAPDPGPALPGKVAAPKK